MQTLTIDYYLTNGKYDAFKSERRRKQLKKKIEMINFSKILLPEIFQIKSLHDQLTRHY